MRLPIDPSIVSRNFSGFTSNPSLQESAQLFSRGLPVAEMVQALAMSPSALGAFAGFASVYPHGQLERGILEKVILCISELNECQFCINSHRDICNRLGIPHSSAAIPDSAEHTDREKLAIEYAVAMHTDSNRVPENLYERIRGSFSPSEWVELTFLVGYINMLNWFNNALGVRYHDEFRSIPRIE